LIKDDGQGASWYHLRMSDVATTVDPRPKAGVGKTNAMECVVQVRARLASLNGGIILSIAILLTAFFGASLLTNQLEAGQTILFGILTLMAWAYVADGATERLSLVGDTMVRASLFHRTNNILLNDLESLLLVHEGLNQEVGIESITARYRDGRKERLPLGPCWRRTDLEAFCSSVEQEMGNRKLLEEVR
jgi:hypothetical protein